MYKHFLKRVFDFILSLLGIIILALPMLIIAIVIKCDSKGPVFFKQKRVGKNKKLFTILKFRTMRTDTPPDAPTHELSDPKKMDYEKRRVFKKNVIGRIAANL